MAAITQPLTVSVFNKSQRSAGTYQTNTATVPEGIYSISLADTMTDAEASDTASSFTLTIQVSPDGVQWREVHREQWLGGTHFNKSTQTFVPNHLRSAWSNSALASGAWLNWSARGVLVQNVQMRVGLDLTAYPAGFNPS